MKSILILGLLILSISSVYGISLSIPKEKEIIFEPNKQATITYSVGNSDPQPLSVEITIDGKELSPYVAQPVQSFVIPPQGSQSFDVALSLPASLQSGLYPIHIKAAEQAPEGGMIGLTGVADVVHVISQYAQGFPYGELLVSKSQEVHKPFNFYVNLQNIGKTPLQSISAKARLVREGQTIQEVSTNTVETMMPLAKGKLSGIFNDPELVAGLYTLEVALGQNLLTEEIVIGQPKVSMLKIDDVIAGEENNLEVTISLDDWSTPLENASTRLAVGKILRSELNITIYPGENKLSFSATARPGKSGTYPGFLTITANGPVAADANFQSEVQGSAAQAGGIGFRKTTEQEVPIQETQSAAPTQPSKDSQSKTFLIVLLIASFAVFAFALGRYLGTNGGKNESQISPP